MAGYHQSSEIVNCLPTATEKVPVLPKHLTIKFKTPYRMIHNGRLLHQKQFAFPIFIMGILRRMALLSTLTNRTLAIDVKFLNQLAHEIPIINPQLTWYEWTRYSNRQQHYVQMGGLMGSFNLPTELLTEFWPWLWWGQWIHTGKGTVMGMGQYHFLTDHNHKLT